jgi:hypothetical protein
MKWNPGIVRLPNPDSAPPHPGYKIRLLFYNTKGRYGHYAAMLNYLCLVAGSQNKAARRILAGVSQLLTLSNVRFSARNIGDSTSNCARKTEIFETAFRMGALR